MFMHMHAGTNTSIRENVNPEINTHSSTPPRKKPISQYELCCCLINGLSHSCVTYYSSTMNKSGKSEPKNVGLVGCCLRCRAMPVILNSMSDICIVDIHSPNYRTVPVSVLHAVIEFSVTGTVSLLDIHQKATVVYESDCIDVQTVQY